jgi:hypothetical protein
LMDKLDGPPVDCIYKCQYPATLTKELVLSGRNVINTALSGEEQPPPNTEL